MTDNRIILNEIIKSFGEGQIADGEDGSVYWHHGTVVDNDYFVRFSIDGTRLTCAVSFSKNGLTAEAAACDFEMADPSFDPCEVGVLTLKEVCWQLTSMVWDKEYGSRDQEYGSRDQSAASILVSEAFRLFGR